MEQTVVCHFQNISIFKSISEIYTINFIVKFRIQQSLKNYFDNILLKLYELSISTRMEKFVAQTRLYLNAIPAEI